MKAKAQTLQELLAKATKINIIQAENPDADSLASALALEDFLTQLDKKVSLYCPVQIPDYLKYSNGWDRVSDEFDYRADLNIVVDTTSQILLSKLFEDPIIKNHLLAKPSIFIDHHLTESDLNFEPTLTIIEPLVATAELIYYLAQELNWQFNDNNSNLLLTAILGDTLGLSTPNLKPETFEVVADLYRHGASTNQIEEKRLELAKKEQEIIKYKGELLQRVEFELDGKLAIIHIPFEEIKQYSDKYNPGALVMDEMRFVKGVEISIAIKTYPDGKLTGRIRSSLPIAETVAGYFGGGGHAHAAGFRIYDETYDSIYNEILAATEKAIENQEREK